MGPHVFRDRIPYEEERQALRGLETRRAWTYCLFIAAGTASCLIGLLSVSPLPVFSLAAISIVALGVLCNLVVGPLMVAAKEVNRKRVMVHQLSAGLIALGLIGAAAFVIMKM